MGVYSKLHVDAQMNSKIKMFLLCTEHEFAIFHYSCVDVRKTFTMLLFMKNFHVMRKYITWNFNCIVFVS